MNIMAALSPYRLNKTDNGSENKTFNSVAQPEAQRRNNAMCCFICYEKIYNSLSGLPVLVETLTLRRIML